MRPTDDQQYFRAREAQERQAARRSSCIVRGVHEEFAELYAELAADTSERTRSDNATGTEHAASKRQ